MTPLHPSSDAGTYTPATQTTVQYQRRPAAPSADRRPDAIERWLQTGEQRSLARLRGPLVWAAQRVGLTSRRCAQLEAGLAQCRDRLLNAPPSMTPEQAQWLEQRVFDLERAVHDERLVLWRDLLPLAESARDASVDAIRSAWLNEFGRALGGDGR